MNLLKRVLIEKRLAVTLVAVAIALDVGLHAFAVYPWSIKVANAEERATRAQANLEAVQQSFAAAQATMEGKTQADAELRKFYNDVLPHDLSGARGITYLRLAALARQTNLRLERRSTAPGQDENSRLASLRTTMLLQGEYRDIRRFIYELETAPEFIVIEEVVLSQGDETDSALVLTLGIATYYWPRTDES